MGLKSLVLTAGILSLVVPIETFAQHCDCPGISTDQRDAYNALLELTDWEVEITDVTHLPWGVPTVPPGATNEIALHQDEYVLNYDADLLVSTWAAYRLRGKDLVIGEPNRRKTCFRRDPRITDDDLASFCADYEQEGHNEYHRGHIVPDKDMAHYRPAQLNTYIFTNMAPQHGTFNTGVWLRLETYTRRWAKARGTLYVVTGSIFDEDGDGQRDADSDAERLESENGDTRVAIPTHFFKILVHEDPNDGSIETLAVVLPHDSEPHTGNAGYDYLEDHITSIDEIEEVTGVNFFRDLPNENAIEAQEADELWELP